MSPPAEGPSRPRRLYIDTSAYLCILLAEFVTTDAPQQEAARELGLPV